MLKVRVVDLVWRVSGVLFVVGAAVVEQPLGASSSPPFSRSPQSSTSISISFITLHGIPSHRHSHHPQASFLYIADTRNLLPSCRARIGYLFWYLPVRACNTHLSLSQTSTYVTDTQPRPFRSPPTCVYGLTPTSLLDTIGSTLFRY